MKLTKKKVALVGVLSITALIAAWESDCGNSGRKGETTDARTSQGQQGQGQREEWKLTTAGAIPMDSIGRSLNTDESERSDRLTGGRIEQTPLMAGDRRIWITVDLPAFRLTLWQNGKEVKTYQIGIGLASFPIPVGEREATEIIWNPEWIPPDSSWVEENQDVAPGERIDADDLRNPLGKIKIPLGGAILIHEAARPADIGRLISHGCVRMLTEDIFDLAEKIVSARGLPVTREQIEEAKLSRERLAVKLDTPLWVDIDYDTQVIEGGVLQLFPDVYHRNGNALDELRLKLLSSGVDAALLDEQTLRQMLGRVSMNEMFCVNITDLKAGRALSAGWGKRIVSSFQFPVSSY